MDIIDPNFIYYVYTLGCPDGTVFYVGKGQGPRILQHEWETQQGCGCRKCGIIRGIWQAGGVVQRAIIFRTNNEAEAYNYEAKAIKQYRCPQLCNSKGTRDVRAEWRERQQGRQLFNAEDDEQAALTELQRRYKVWRSRNTPSKGRKGS